MPASGPFPVKPLGVPFPGMRVLVTGATGYVGGRLVPRLLSLGHEVSVLVRDVQRLQEFPWKEKVTVRQGNLSDRESIKQGLGAVRGRLSPSPYSWESLRKKKGL
jgi:uncharacterized protein YbjT (DUF2867 family)